MGGLKITSLTGNCISITEKWIKSGGGNIFTNSAGPFILLNLGCPYLSGFYNFCTLIGQWHLFSILFSGSQCCEDVLH